MTKKNIVLIVLIFSILSCSTKNNKSISKHFFLEEPLPKNVLEKYLEKTSLPNIENGIGDFELRKWFPFYHLDCFPVALERIYVQNGILNADCFLFSDKNGGLITSKDELQEFQFEKFTITNLPNQLLDSLRLRYSLALIDTFDFNLIKDKMATGYTTGTPREYFFEQSDEKNYYATFISDPEFFPELHPSIDKYADLGKFIHNVFILNDSTFKEWFDGNASKIVNSR